MACLLLCCGPLFPEDKGLPPEDESTTTTGRDLTTSGDATTGATSATGDDSATTTATTDSLTGGAVTGTGSASGGTSSSTTDPTTGGPECVPILCGGDPCLDANGEVICAPLCGLGCRVDEDCGLVGVLFCSDASQCIDKGGTVICG
jgi:hypothetical protein